MVDKSLPTKDRLLRAGVKLFSQYGYAATSVRMVTREAQANDAAINFHFGSKRGLYDACVNFILDKIVEYYGTSYAKVEEALNEGDLAPEKAREYLEKLIALQIEVAFGEQYQTTLKLVYWENNEVADEDAHPLSTVVFKRQEEILSQLIMCITGTTEERALLASRQINGGIVTFGEHKHLTDAMLPASGTGEGLPFWVKEELVGNCLAIVDRLAGNVHASPAVSRAPKTTCTQ